MIVQINIERREAECFDIRKLTPRECYRLMAVRDESIDRLLASPLAQSAHYKLAGNSIVQDVLTAIFRQIWLCGQEPPTEGPLELFPEEPWPERLLPEGRPLEVVTLCSGYDSQCLALDALAATPEGRGLRYRLAAWAEFDPDSRRPLAEQPAVVAHRALFSPDEPRPASACVSVGPNLGDMTKIDWGEFVKQEIKKRNSYGNDGIVSDGDGARAEAESETLRQHSGEVATERGHQVLSDEREEGRSARTGMRSSEERDAVSDSGSRQSCDNRLRQNQVLTYEVDLLTYSTPCQSISQAGKREGIAEGSGTRSAVLWYTLEALRRLRPRFALQENVAALVNQQNMPHFRRWQQQVSELGYDNYWAVLNAADYGVPQNRDRVFMVSVRKDLGLPPFRFPRPVRLERSIADVLEPDVDPRYFLRPESVVSFLTKNETDGKFMYMTTDHEPSPDEIREYIKQQQSNAEPLQQESH